MQAFTNRLLKNWKHRKKWAAKEGLTAFRVYDFDMPEHTVAVDAYAGLVHVTDVPRRAFDLDVRKQGFINACVEVFGVPASDVFYKVHRRHKPGETQYERVSRASVTRLVEEHGLTFEVNLSDYTDTGLFLDHRETRAMVRSMASGQRVLNLFAYTGSFSVAAAVGGALTTTTVDLSNTYCTWAERNLTHNRVSPSKAHQVIRADVLEWIAGATGTFDLIVLDPPSFSKSKMMNRTWDVQRDHARLIDACLARLAAGGSLFFSTNLSTFHLDGRFKAVEDLSEKTLPDDFRRVGRRCYRFLGQ